MTPSNDEQHNRIMGSEVQEHSLPGIGMRYDLSSSGDSSLVVVIHHSGRRDLYVMDAARSNPKAVVELTDSQARTLGAVLGGAYFKPAVAEEIEAVIGELLIDWVTLPAGAPGEGQSIAELGVRKQTRMTIAAILRDHEPRIAPEPSEVLRAGDRLVVVGRQEDLPGFLDHVVGRG